MTESSSDKNTRSAILFPLVCALIGAVLLFFPNFVINILSTALGCFCILYGAWRLILAVHMTGFTRGGTLVGGILAIVLGIYIINHAEQIFMLLPIAASIYFLFNGIDRIRSALEMYRMAKRSAAYLASRGSDTMKRQTRRFIITTVIGIVTLLCGVFLFLYPFNAVIVTLRIVGALIILDSISALWTMQTLKSVIRFFEEPENGAPRAADGKYNAEFRDISDE